MGNGGLEGILAKVIRVHPGHEILDECRVQVWAGSLESVLASRMVHRELNMALF